MPIGVVSDAQLEEELKSNGRVRTPSVPRVTILPPVDQPTRGRNKGDVNVPDSLRKVIGETAVIDGRQAAIELANDFGISPASVSAYAKGATSTASYNTPAQGIISHINKSRRRAIKKASATLNAALSSITQEKLDYADASDLSGIAKDMSAIIKNLEPTAEPGSVDGKTQPQFVIYAPTFRDERSFETITVQE